MVYLICLAVAQNLFCAELFAGLSEVEFTVFPQIRVLYFGTLRCFIMKETKFGGSNDVNKIFDV